MLEMQAAKLLSCQKIQSDLQLTHYLLIKHY